MHELGHEKLDGEEPHIGWSKIGRLILEKIGIGSPESLRALGLGSDLYSPLYGPSERPRRIQLTDAFKVFPAVAEQALLSMLHSSHSQDRLEAIELLVMAEVNLQFAIDNLEKMTRDGNPEIAGAAEFWLNIRKRT